MEVKTKKHWQQVQKSFEVFFDMFACCGSLTFEDRRFFNVATTSVFTEHQVEPFWFESWLLAQGVTVLLGSMSAQRKIVLSISSSFNKFCCLFAFLVNNECLHSPSVSTESITSWLVNDIGQFHLLLRNLVNLFSRILNLKHLDGVLLKTEPI